MYVYIQALVALVGSFWVIYSLYRPHAVFLSSPAELYSQYELIPEGSIYRDSQLKSCWPDDACIDRNIYCFTR